MTPVAGTPGGPSAQHSGEPHRDRDLWPRGNTAPETTLLSGYGVDTLGWADNVRGTGSSCCPGEFQRELTRRAREQRRTGGTSPTLLPAWAWPGTPSPIQSYTRRGSMRSQSAWITALDLVSSRTRPGGLFLDSFLTHFGGVFGRFLAAPKSRTIPRPAGLTYCKIGSSPSRREGAPLDFLPSH